MDKNQSKIKVRNKGWDNLKPAKKGEVRNPNGRPKLGNALSDIMREYLDGTINTDNGEITRKEAFVRAVYARAMKGGDAAQRLIMQHIDGMPVQKIQFEKPEEIFDDLDKLSAEEIKSLHDIDKKLHE